MLSLFRLPLPRPLQLYFTTCNRRASSISGALPKKQHAPLGPAEEAEGDAQLEKFLAQKALEKPSRPHLKVQVDPDHGLWGFFRKIEKNGEWIVETVEKNSDLELSGEQAQSFCS